MTSRNTRIVLLAALLAVGGGCLGAIPDESTGEAFDPPACDNGTDDRPAFATALHYVPFASIHSSTCGKAGALDLDWYWIDTGDAPNGLLVSVTLPHPGDLMVDDEAYGQPGAPIAEADSSGSAIRMLLKGQHRIVVHEFWSHPEPVPYELVVDLPTTDGRDVLRPWPMRLGPGGAMEKGRVPSEGEAWYEVLPQGTAPQRVEVSVAADLAMPDPSELTSGLSLEAYDKDLRLVDTSWWNLTVHGTAPLFVRVRGWGWRMGRSDPQSIFVSANPTD